MPPIPPALSQRRAAVAVAVVVAVLGLGGCADDGEPRSDPTWTPSATPEAPRTSPADAPTRPALPEAATKATPAGARAFIKHYWALINYAQATGDVKSLRQASGRNCSGCRAVIEGIRSRYADGLQISGGEHSVRVVRLTEITPELSSAYAFEAVVNVAYASQEIARPDGSVDERGPGEATFNTYVIWASDGRWRTDVQDIE